MVQFEITGCQATEFRDWACAEPYHFLGRAVLTDRGYTDFQVVLGAQQLTEGVTIVI